MPVCFINLISLYEKILSAEPAYPKGDSSGSTRRSWELRTLISQTRGKRKNVECLSIKQTVSATMCFSLWLTRPSALTFYGPFCASGVTSSLCCVCPIPVSYHYKFLWSRNVCFSVLYSLNRLMFILCVTWVGPSHNPLYVVCVLSRFSHVQLFATVWTVAHQAPLSVGFSRQEYWSGLPCPPPGEFPDPGIKWGSPALQAHCLSAELPRKPCH